MNLRDYQAAGCSWIEASWHRLPLAGRRPAVVYQLPTGGGKTPMQAELVERAKERGLTAAVMAPGIDLCRQLRARVGCEVHLTTTLASLHKRGLPLPRADVWLVDEARCITSPGVSPVVLALQASGARMAFFDATPETAQGTGLAAWADDLRQGPSVRELVTAGYLVPSRVFSAEQGRGLARSPVEVWLQLAWYGRICQPNERFPAPGNGRKRRALIFAKDKAHARSIVADFAARLVPAAFIGDDTPGVERERLLGWTDAHGTFHPGALARGEAFALVCASLLRQGIDIPEIELVISARAFDSEPLARQAWGRGMRVCPEIGKLDCVMVDLVGGIVDRVGLPDDERVWSLEGEACRTAGEALPACVQCRACLSWGRGGVCRALVPRGGLWVECGYALPPPPPPRVMVRDLVEVFADDSQEQRARTLLRFVGEAWLAGRAKGKTGRDLIKAGWSGAYRWGNKYPVAKEGGGMVASRPAPRDVARAMRDTGIARLVLMAWVRVVGLCGSADRREHERSKDRCEVQETGAGLARSGSGGVRSSERSDHRREQVRGGLQGGSVHAGEHQADAEGGAARPSPGREAVEEEAVSRGKPGALKAAVRPRSDAGHAGWRPRVDMAASMQVNGLRPSLSTPGGVPLRDVVRPMALDADDKPIDLEADIEAGRVLDIGAVVRMRAAERAAESARQRPPNPIEYPPIDPGSPRETAALVRELESFGAVAAPVEPHEPRRMTQPGLFDSLGVKV